MNVLTYEQLKQQLDAVVAINANHVQTLAGIRNMNPATEGERMQQWASDALSGYTEPVEATIKSLMDENLALTAENAELISGLRCVYTTAFTPVRPSHGDIRYVWDYVKEPKEEIEQWISEAKTTAAALAEVGAKAIEKFAAHLHDQAPHVEECDMESYEVFGHLATEFASTLREAR
ncbi:hypothetical protein AV650_22275 [Serratia fonticola]|nr:hypothetical protein AV650_15330 [Serratia fonticola]ALX96098.1 hypothetical protein AV650_22275 [Serratia fonticola]